MRRAATTTSSGEISSASTPLAPESVTGGQSVVHRLRQLTKKIPGSVVKKGAGWLGSSLRAPSCRIHLHLGIFILASCLRLIVTDAHARCHGYRWDTAYENRANRTVKASLARRVYESATCSPSAGSREINLSRCPDSLLTIWAR